MRMRELAPGLPVVLLGGKGEGDESTQAAIVPPYRGEELRRRVRALLPSGGQGPEEGPQAKDYERLSLLLEELDNLLQSGNTRALDCLASLRRLWQAGPPPDWQSLVQQVEGYDFKRARRTLARITRRVAKNAG